MQCRPSDACTPRNIAERCARFSVEGLECRLDDRVSCGRS